MIWTKKWRWVLCGCCQKDNEMKGSHQEFVIIVRDGSIIIIIIKELSIISERHFWWCTFVVWPWIVEMEAEWIHWEVRLLSIVVRLNLTGVYIYIYLIVLYSPLKVEGGLRERREGRHVNGRWRSQNRRRRNRGRSGGFVFAFNLQRQKKERNERFQRVFPRNNTFITKSSRIWVNPST